MTTLLCTEISVKEQTGFGTKATGAANTWVPIDHLGGIPTTTNELFTPPTVNGNKGIKQAVAGKVSGAHSIKTLGIPDSYTGWLLKWLFGVHTPTALGGGAYKHVFNAAECADPYCFTIRNNVGGYVTDVIDTAPSGLTITVGAGDLLNFEWPCLYTHEKESTAQVLTFEKRLPFTWADALLQINGVDFKAAENFNLTISNGAEHIFMMNNSRWAGKISTPSWVVKAGMSLELDDDTHLKRVWGDAAATQPTSAVYEASFSATFTSTEEIGSSGQYYKLKIDMPVCVYSAYTVEAGDPYSRIIQNIEFTPLVDDVSGYDIQIELTNGDDDYPDA